MASGSFGLTRTGSTSSYVSFTAYWSSTTNVATNQSTVTVTIKASKSSASTSKTYGTYNTRTTVEGTNKDKGNTSFTLNPNSTITLSTQSFTVNHNDNGTKSTTISCSVGGDVMWGNGSQTVTLDTIPRASTITCTSANIGETAQITVTKKYSGFTHVIAYDINGSGGRETGYILADGSTTQSRTQISATSIGFPIPTRWYSLIPNDSSVIVNLGVDTYSGNTQIGSTQTTTFIARVNPETNRPTLTASVIDTNESFIALTGDNKRLVKGYSYAKLDYSATPKNYATIRSVNVNGTNVSASPYYFTLNQNTINVTATDSRGLTTTVNPSFTLVDYFQPNFTLRAVRVEPTSSYFKILFEGSFFNNTFGKVMNTINLRWRYKESSSSEWIIGGMLTSGADYKIIGNKVISGTEDVANEIVIGGNFDYNKAWDIKLEVWDMVKTVEVISNVTKGIPVFWWNEENLYSNSLGWVVGSGTKSDGSSGNGSTGYIKFMTVKTKANYADMPLHIMIGQRGKPPVNLYVCFTNKDSTDTTLKFTKVDSYEIPIYYCKSGAGAYDFYVQKVESFDHVIIFQLNKPIDYEGGNYDLIKKDDLVTSLPSGYSQVQRNDIVQSITVTSETTEVQFNNLNMVKDGGTYYFTALHSDGGEFTDLGIRFNGLTTGYHQVWKTVYGTRNSDGDLSVSNSYRQGTGSIYGYTNSSPLKEFPAVMEGKFYILNNQYKTTIGYELTNKCAVKGRQVLTHLTGVSSLDISNITSLTFYKTTGKLMPGSKITIRRAP